LCLANKEEEEEEGGGGHKIMAKGNRLVGCLKILGIAKTQQP